MDSYKQACMSPRKVKEEDPRKTYFEHCPNRLNSIPIYKLALFFNLKNNLYIKKEEKCLSEGMLPGRLVEVVEVSTN